MYYYITKIVVSALLIVLISEISKRSSLLGAVFASIPLISVLAILWIYIDTKNVEQISSLSTSIFWLVLPSLVFFIALPVFLKYQINFYVSLFSSIAIMVLCYLFMLRLLKILSIEF